jgi:hypothetical protein
MTVQTHQLKRSMRALTLGTVRDFEQAGRPSLSKLQELDQHFQLPITGEAGSIVSWSEAKVSFNAYMIDAREQRSSPYIRPLFTYGAVIDSPTPVCISACIVKWKGSEEDGFTGATVGVGVYSPGTVEAIKFRGHLHLCFSGYGALRDDPEEN